MASPSKPTLSLVSEDSTSKRLTVKEAAGRTERDLLVSLRDRIASDIDKGVPAHALAPLSRQLREIAKEIQSIDAHNEGDEVGDAADTPDEEWTAT